MNQNGIIDKFGIYFDEVGLNKTYGRLFGLFMIAHEPLSMGKIVERLQISKSSASSELKRLMAMGVIEKVLLPEERADFYQLKRNIWVSHLYQKINDIKKLQSIIEEIPPKDSERSLPIREMADYCHFIEEELKILAEKYIAIEKTFGSFIEDIQGKKFIVEWSKLSAVSDAYASKMIALAPLGVEAFQKIEMDFLNAYPQAMQEDENLAPFYGLNPQELENGIKMRLEKIFHQPPNERMAEFHYYVVTIKEEASEDIKGFVIFMGGGTIAKNAFKIIVLAIEEKSRGMGLASCLIHSLNKIGVSCKKLFASTRPSNIAALQAYKKWGFTQDEEAVKNPHFIKGHWVHLTWKIN